MAKSRLTAVFVKAVKEPDKYYDESDLSLFRQVYPTGAHSWQQRLTINRSSSLQ